MMCFLAIEREIFIMFIGQMAGWDLLGTSQVPPLQFAGTPSSLFHCCSDSPDSCEIWWRMAGHDSPDSGLLFGFWCEISGRMAGHDSPDLTRRILV